MTLLNKAKKDEQRNKILSQKRAQQDKLRQDVSYLKEEKQQTKELHYHQNNQHMAKATMIKTIIKQQQDDAKDKKQRDLFDKKMKARQQMQEKMAREATMRMEHES